MASCKAVLKESLEKAGILGRYQEIKDGAFLSQIRSKGMNNDYACVEEFIVDLKKFYDAYKDDKVMRPLVTTFKNHILKDLIEARKCFSCVSNYYASDFTAICKHPHVLVWARYLSEPFWPAKVYTIDAIGKKITVKFFGSKHETAQIVLNGRNAYLITSEKYPKYFLKDQKGKVKKFPKIKHDLDRALDELSEHLVNLKESFPNKVLYRESTELIQYDGTYLYLEDIDGGATYEGAKETTDANETQSADDAPYEDADESVGAAIESAGEGSAIYEETEPDSKLDKTNFKGSSELASLSADPDYQPIVVLDNMTNYVILKRSHLLIPHMSFEEIAHMQSVTWDNNEYPEEEAEPNYDLPPGVNVEQIDESHQTLIQTFLSTTSERRQRACTELRTKLMKEMIELRKKITFQREFQEKQLHLVRSSIKERLKKEVEKLSADKKIFMKTLTPDGATGEVIHPELKELQARHLEEINELKRTPFCCVCTADAVQEFSDDGPFCSVNCVLSGPKY